MTADGKPAQACPPAQPMSADPPRKPRRPPTALSGQRSCGAQFRPHGSAAKRRMYFLHAISRQHVHPRLSPQVTVPQRPPATARVPARCGTFLLYFRRPAT